MDRYDLSDAQTGIIVALLERRARLTNEISGQLDAYATLLRSSYGVGEEWQLTGSPQTGFALVPPEKREKPDEEGAL